MADHNWQSRRLGRTILRSYRTTVDIDDIVPNDNQPRMGPKEDPELQRQIVANEGIFEPLLLEPHPEHEGRFRIIDGDRRWSNSKVLVEVQKRDEYRKLPAEIVDRTLTDDERLRVWIYIHRQRKEWDAKEKEMVAYRLVDLVGRASAASILGITVKALDKLVDIYELSEKLRNVNDPGASITWAREIKNISRNLVSPSVLDAIVQKINDRRITNSKDVRRLRQILRDPVAKDEFLSARGTIESAVEKLAPTEKNVPRGLAGDVAALIDSIRSHSWTTMASMKGDPEVLRKIDEAERLLGELRRELSNK